MFPLKTFCLRRYIIKLALPLLLPRPVAPVLLYTVVVVLQTLLFYGYTVLFVPVKVHLQPVGQ